MQQVLSELKLINLNTDEIKTLPSESTIIISDDNNSLNDSLQINLNEIQIMKQSI